MLEQNETLGKLLLVDDEENILKSLRRLFAPMGYEVSIANSGKQGLELLEKQAIDVVISDMRMPEMDGAAFLKQVAERWPATRRLLLTGYADINSAISAINEGQIDFYLSKPWKDDQLEVAVHNAMESKRLKDRNRELEHKIKQQNNELKYLNENLEEKVKAQTVALQAAYDSLDKSFNDMMEVFASVIEMSEHQNQGHCRRVAKLSKAIAENMKINANDCQAIYFAGLLHAIGKISLPNELQTKPYLSMTKSERAKFEKYPVLGQITFISLDGLSTVASIILHHREYYNGRGYPDNLVAEHIPIGARILNVVLEFLELQLGLVRKEKLTAQQALDYIKSQKSILYDPEVVDCLLNLVHQLPEQEKLLHEIKLTADSLELGMELARDLIGENGMLLLPKGFKLNSKMIDSIKKLENIVVYVKKN
ncbi:MAG: two-component system response regulator [Gammaproteobacteria bacterium]